MLAQLKYSEAEEYLQEVDNILHEGADYLSVTNNKRNAFRAVAQRAQANKEKILVEAEYGGENELFTSYAFATGQCIDLRYVSEEDQVQLAECPSGYAVKGIRCDNSYCDNKILRCCPYMRGMVEDNSGSHYWSGYFSEEKPSEYKDVEGFVVGLSCGGRYCDNISLQAIRSSNLKNSGQCYSSPFFSEERPSYGECSKNFFMSGLTCRGKYCDNISLFCCRAQHSSR